MYTQKNAILALGMLFMPIALTAKAEMFNPDFDTMYEIVVELRDFPAWRGTFYCNGTARFGRGSGIGTWGYTPAGSFFFEEIYTLVAPHLKTGHSDNKEILGIGFYFCDSNTNFSHQGFYIEDKKTIRKIMHGLADKVSPSINPFLDEASFRRLLMTVPLVPGDPPYWKGSESFNTNTTPVYNMPIVTVWRDSTTIVKVDMDGRTNVVVANRLASNDTTEPIEEAPTTETPPDIPSSAVGEYVTKPIIAPEEKHSRLWLALGITLGVLVGIGALLYLRKAKA